MMETGEVADALDAPHPVVDPATRRAIHDPGRTTRNRRKHRLGVSS